MNNYELTRGQNYELQTEGIGFPGEVTHVRREYLPSTGEDWETFFGELGLDDDKFLYRLRLPSESIKEVKGNKVISRKELTSNLIWEEIEHTPLVKSWLKEVDGIKTQADSAR